MRESRSTWWNCTLCDWHNILPSVRACERVCVYASVCYLHKTFTTQTHTILLPSSYCEPANDWLTACSAVLNLYSTVMQHVSWNVNVIAFIVFIVVVYCFCEWVQCPLCYRLPLPPPSPYCIQNSTASPAPTHIQMIIIYSIVVFSAEYARKKTKKYQKITKKPNYCRASESQKKSNQNNSYVAFAWQWSVDTIHYSVWYTRPAYGLRIDNNLTWCQPSTDNI